MNSTVVSPRSLRRRYGSRSRKSVILATAIAGSMLAPGSSFAHVHTGPTVVTGTFTAIAPLLAIWTPQPGKGARYFGALTSGTGPSPNVLFTGGGLTDLPSVLSFNVGSRHGYLPDVGPVLTGDLTLTYVGPDFVYEGNTIVSGNIIFNDHVTYDTVYSENFGNPYAGSKDLGFVEGFQVQSDVFHLGGPFGDSGALRFSAPLLASTTAQSADFLSGDVRFATPEPSTWALVIVGMAGLGVILRGQRRRLRAPAGAGGRVLQV